MIGEYIEYIENQTAVISLHPVRCFVLQTFDNTPTIHTYVIHFFKPFPVPFHQESASSFSFSSLFFPFFYFPFLDASSHLYMRVCPSVRRSIGLSVRRSATRFLTPEIERKHHKMIEKAEIWVPDCK